MKKKLLSVIIPAYKAEKIIQKDILYTQEALKVVPFDYEIIVVVDGMIDKTFEKARECQSTKVKVYGYEKNWGKGYAVRYGMARAKGDPIAFIDAGMEIDPRGLSMALEHLEWYKADIVVGSKLHPVSEVHYPIIRQFLSKLAQIANWLLFGLKVRDTQLGLKIYRRAVLEKVLPRLLLKRFAFDIELLAVANYLGFTRIYEAPVRYAHRFPSTVTLFGPNGVSKTLWDTLAVFYRLKIRRYYDDVNQRAWRYDPDLNFRVNLG